MTVSGDRLASLKEGRIEGDQITLVSRSCVILIGCYEYIYEGKLITSSRMDMYGTDDDGGVVNFLLEKR